MANRAKPMGEGPRRQRHGWLRQTGPTLSSTLAACLLPACLLLACGASPRMMHQSTGYYEQCHAVELDPDRSLDERRLCWVAWLTHYAQDQTLERLGYAQERRIALAHGESVVPLPGDHDPGHELGNGFDVTRVNSTTSAIEDRPETPPDQAQNSEEASQGQERTEAAPRDTYEENEVHVPFRQHGGAPEGRHYPVRAIPPAIEIPRPRAPSSTNGCRNVCEPRWDHCVSRCETLGQTCVATCETHFVQCLAGCH